MLHNKSALMENAAQTFYALYHKMANYYFKLCMVSLVIRSSLGDVQLLLFVTPTTLYESKTPGIRKLTLQKQLY